MKKVVRTAMLSLASTAFALSGAPTASAQDLGLALTGMPNLDNLAEKGLIKVDQSTLGGLPNLNTLGSNLNAVGSNLSSVGTMPTMAAPTLSTVQEAGIPGIEGRAASELASTRGLVSGAVEKLPQVDSMDMGKLKAASVQNNSLVGPLNALCGPLAENANCSSTTLDKRLSGQISQKDETLVGYGKSAF